MDRGLKVASLSQWTLADLQPYLDICTQARRLRMCRFPGSEGSADSVRTPSRSLRTGGKSREVVRADENAAYRAPAVPPLVDLPVPGSIHPAYVETAANVETVLDAGPAPVLMYPSVALDTSARCTCTCGGRTPPMQWRTPGRNVRDEALPPMVNARAVLPAQLLLGVLACATGVPTGRAVLHGDGTEGRAAAHTLGLRAALASGACQDGLQTSTERVARRDAAGATGSSKQKKQ